MALGRRSGLFALEKHFAFYGAYHSNKINIAIHVLFVWPIFFSALLILYFVPLPPLFNLQNLEFSMWENYVILVWNVGFLVALLYSVFYVSLDLKAGSLAALLCALCWIGSSFVASQLGLSLAWKVNNVVGFCWYEHGNIWYVLLFLWIHGRTMSVFHLWLINLLGFIIDLNMVLYDMFYYFCEFMGEPHVCFSSIIAHFFFSSLESN